MKTRGVILILIIVLIGINNAYATSNSQNNGCTQKLSQIDGKYTEISEISVQTIKITTKITAEQAQKIAKKYIMVQGAYPGNPTLFYQKASGSFKGGYLWDVPIMKNGKRVNGIVIDAQTGANLGEK